VYNTTTTYETGSRDNGSAVLKKNVSGLKNGAKSTPLDSRWAECLQIIRDNTTESIFKTWILQLKPLKYDKMVLTLKVPSQFVVDWVENNVYDLLLKTVYRVFGEGSTIDFKIVIDRSNAKKERTMTIPGAKKPTRQSSLDFTAAPDQTDGQAVEKKKEMMPDNLDHSYTFANFVMGDANQFAASASKAVADKPLKNSYSPLYIYGKTGTGKTHLLNSIGNHIKSKNRDLNVFYTSANKFQNQFVEAVLNNATSALMQMYRKVDVLLIDDIHSLSEKEKTQDNFFHIFNELYMKGKLIVISSDKAYSELVGIEERLVSRFSQGLHVDIQAPDYETRLAIVLKKSRDEGKELPMEIAQFIAESVTQNIRNLEGAIIKLLAAVAFGTEPLSLELAKKVLGTDVQIEKKKAKLDVNVIQELVSVHMGITVEDMRSKSRKHEIALARQMAITLTKNLTRLTLKQIGAAFGGRDHATVLHSIRTIENYCFTDQMVKKDYETLYNQCYEYI
jgi:chromosomal replication initiator protein